MTSQSNTVEAQKSVALKLSEPVIDPHNPWGDDLLARQHIATRLTSLVEAQEPPLTISLHGHWGTGKTYLLKRWQKQLEQTGFKAIYFNAWEDDFCDDPLLAIIGQMSDYFKKGGLKTIAHRAAAIATPLLKESLIGVVRTTTGVTLPIDQKQNRNNPLDAYFEQRAIKDKLTTQLARLSNKVASETAHPLIFIVDELDRCRPTFAIELLERVKHVFEVPHTVFVFGLNRDELSKSLSAAYGDIDTDVYLRRFFDFEFNLPAADSRSFTEQLIDKFQLRQVFQGLSEAAGRSDHIYDYENYRTVFPRLWSALGLSLRDIDYGIRLLALLTRSLSLGAFTHPYMLAVLIAMKFKKPEFYRQMVSTDFRTSEIMNYIDEELKPGPMDERLHRDLDRCEAFLYCADNSNHHSQAAGESALSEIQQRLEGYVGVDFRVISSRAQNADSQRLQRMAQTITDGRSIGIDAGVLGYLATLIDAYQTQLRR